MSSDSSPVPKQSAKGKSRLQRLFDGWQAGVTIIVISSMTLAIAIPRPATPQQVPLPIPNHRHLIHLADRQERLASQVEHTPLPFDSRALGESLRQYGIADNTRNVEKAQRLLAAIQVQRKAALHNDGPDSLLKLRAYQAHVFLTEFERYVETGKVSDDLKQVGGSIVATVNSAGWIETTGSHRSLLADPHALRAIFNKRWNALTGLQHETPFKLSLDEQRAIYALLLRHPKPPSAQAPSTTAEGHCRTLNNTMLHYIGRLGQLDPDYPTKYARGLVLLRMGSTKQAVQALADFVEHHPDGPYVLPARNALRQAEDIILKQTKR